MKKILINLFSIVIVLNFSGTQSSLWYDYSNALNGRNSPSVVNANNYYQVVTRQPTEEKVNIRLYYESLCPDCREFDTKQLTPVVAKLQRILDIRTYPYGNAKTIVHANGTFEFNCQHGPLECYGNQLHACAINILGSASSYVPFNSCMMEPTDQGKGSDDRAADKCGMRLGFDSNSIKQCAKSSRGAELLKYYGEESKKVGFSFVPYILINGVLNDGSNLFKDVCDAFTNKPRECLA